VSREIIDARGCVFNIQQFSVHDGPGIRTLVFLSGCPLRCSWCCNPESQSGQPELAYNDKKCIGTNQCDGCLPACPVKAISIGGTGAEIIIDREACTACGDCAAVCPSKALEMLGRYMSVSEVIRVVSEDGCFYARSGGGLTLSGGEPLFQPEFSLEILKEAKRLSLDTAIETCGQGRWEDMKEISSLVDCVFYDIKCCDSQKHKEFTGVSNELILDNFEHLAHVFPGLPIVVRTPIIPSFNDTPRDIAAVTRLVAKYPNVSHELMPHHAFGISKYGFLGRRYGLAEIQPPTSEQMRVLKEAASRDCNL
jgi:pyruvate formate lyase activating enzyme